MLDKGNHFYKCDLQIHTPRDLNWDGAPAVSDSERKAFAATFIKRCRKGKLDAVAITDHHDLCLFPFIKEAAESEVDSFGNPVPRNEQLIVFPGIELTLSSPPCQGLLILDASFPESLFPTVLGALSLAQADKSESKTAQTVAIPTATIGDICDIYTKLDATDGVKGRYIFLPHVKEKGHKTLMRQGFHHHYANMPSVGGYIDGALVNPNVGYQKIVDGEVEAYGFKSIGLIQTSDHRSDTDFPSDSPATWIKFKEPTAEAIRQACLAKESRISLKLPETPNIFIEKIDVTNSAFLSAFELEFNPQLNSIIGGRGSGKSTILEYLRWCLCDQTDYATFSIGDTVSRKRSTLIDNTLANVNGEVRVFFSVNGTRHIIKRSASSENVLLKIGESEFKTVHPTQIKSLLPIQAYSQKQLSNVAVTPAELKRVIEQPIAEDIGKAESTIKSTSSKVSSTYKELVGKIALEKEIRKLEVEIDSYKQQIEKLQEGLQGITEEDKQILDRTKFYTAEKNRLSEIDIEYDRVGSSLVEAQSVVFSLLTKSNPKHSEFENQELFSRIESERQRFLEEIDTLFRKVHQQREESLLRLQSYKGDWQRIRDSFSEKYKKAKENSCASESTLKAIKELEDKIEELSLLLRQKRASLEKIEVTVASFEEALAMFLNALEARLSILRVSADKFTELSEGLIVVDHSRTLDSAKLAEDIAVVFSSHKLNIQLSRSEALADKVATSVNQIETWGRFVKEFRALFEKLEGGSTDTPLLDSVGFTSKNKEKISEELSSDGFTRLATINLNFVPKFLYTTNNQLGDTVPFEEASAGQQATALLNVLLNQGGYPLVIDQPEDDIDNRAIEKIIRSFWRAKKTRQIIISSHNANLVVNGDSELVVSCDYNESSDQTRGKVKHIGSIDDKGIKEEITSIMEGGEKAFKLRKEKYGF